MSEDIEALLRSGLAERADAAPSFDDPDLADLAIAGAGRIRRRRRVAAAAGGTGLLVLGAAVFAWNPWIAPDDKHGDGHIAADTAEAQEDLGIEFLVQEEDGTYSVLNADGETLDFGDATEPTGYVYGLTTRYMMETESHVWTLTPNGDELLSAEKPAEETATMVNSTGDSYAMVTPNAEYTAEEYSLVDVSVRDATEEVAFTTSYDITLADWNDETAVFTADLNPVTGGEPGSYYFNDDFTFGLESVSAAGFEAAVLIDHTDPSNVCVADLDATGTSSETELCGPVVSANIQDELAAAVGPDDDPTSIVDTAITNLQSEGMLLADEGGMDLGEYQRQYESAEVWADPGGRWQLAGNRGGDTWLLVDTSGDEPVASELKAPEGTVMPVLSYT